MKRILALVALSILASSPAHTATAPPAPRVIEPGIGARTDSLLERYSQYGYSGVALVERNGRPLLHRGYGLADRERRTPIQVDTRFAIASITKTFTAAAILGLAERSRLALDDSLGRFFDGLPSPTSGITIAQLLEHASGLPEDEEEQGLDTRTSEATRASLARARLRHAPGADRRYSNFGYNVLARVVERVTGLRFDAFVRDSLMARAGLRSTTFSSSGPGLARGYGGPIDALEPTAPPPIGTHLGSGSLVSTAADLGRWLNALREGRVVSRAAWERMIADTTGETSCGWTRGRTGWGTTLVTSGGDWDGYQTDIFWFPDDSLTVILVTNIRPNTFRWNGTLVRAVARAERGRPTVMPPALTGLDSTALRPYPGTYRLDSGGRFDVRRRGGVLYVGAEGQDAVNPLAWPGVTPPAALGACNARADSLVAALAAGDTAYLARVAEAPEIATSVRDWWREHVGASGAPVGPPTGLGTAPKGPAKLETFVRLGTGPDPMVIRLVWRLGSLALTAIGSGIPFPATTLFLPEGRGRFAAYDPPTDQVVRIGFAGAGGVDSLTVHTASGADMARGRRER